MTHRHEQLAEALIKPGELMECVGPDLLISPVKIAPERLLLLSEAARRYNLLMQAIDEGRVVLMPARATAESGMKYALIGEFHITYETYDEDTETMVECKKPVEWMMIKDIYAAAVSAVDQEKILKEACGE